MSDGFRFRAVAAFGAVRWYNHWYSWSFKAIVVRYSQDDMATRYPGDDANAAFVVDPLDLARALLPCAAGSALRAAAARGFL